MKQLRSVLSGMVQQGAAGALAGERQSAVDREALAARLEEPPEAFAGEQEILGFLRHHFPPPEEPPEDLLADALPGDVLDRYLSTWERGETAIRPNEVYLHPDYVSPERAGSVARLDDVLGVTLGDDDLDVRNGLAFVAPSGVERVRRAVARRIGGRRRDALERVAEDGVPQPVVENLDMNVKLSLDENLNASVVNSETPPADLATEAVGEMSARMHFK